MDILHSIRTTLQNLPHAPGVYIFKDAHHHVLYVGKAKHLAARVRSYFQPSRKLEASKETMMHRITSIDVIVAPSETDALILEATFIKKHQPPYNIILKDDKYFLYIRVTLSDEFPTIDLVRSMTKKSDKYFGPFTSAAAARETVKTMKRIFKFRTCTPHQGKPCFDYTIGKCLGPCVDAITVSEYKEMIQDVFRFLRGKNDDVLAELTTRMKKASQEEKFERAATLRDRIRALEKVTSRQVMISQRPFEFDVLGITKEKRTAAVALLQIRSGKLLHKQTMTLSNKPDASERNVLEAFISQYYSASAEHPRDVYCELVPEEKNLLERTFDIRIHRATRGDKTKLTKTAHANAQLALQNYFASFEKDAIHTNKTLKNIQIFFGLASLPKRIESFDVANIQGSHAVGSMVVFLDGKPARNLYKRFSIETVQGINDPAMIAEIISRRLVHLVSHDTGWERPDLILVDGGKGQLSGIKKIPQLNKQRLNIIALAKGGHAQTTQQSNRERFFTLDNKEFTLPATSSELFMLERIRDEAHRFAIRFYRKKHGESSLKSDLEKIPGIGTKRLTDLIRHFGSQKRVSAASEQELAAVVGPALARTILSAIHTNH